MSLFEIKIALFRYFRMNQFQPGSRIDHHVSCIRPFLVMTWICFRKYFLFNFIFLSFSLANSSTDPQPSCVPSQFLSGPRSKRHSSVTTISAVPRLVVFRLCLRLSEAHTRNRKQTVLSKNQEYGNRLSGRKKRHESSSKASCSILRRLLTMCFYT